MDMTNRTEITWRLLTTLLDGVLSAYKEFSTQATVTDEPGIGIIIDVQGVIKTRCDLYAKILALDRFGAGG